MSEPHFPFDRPGFYDPELQSASDKLQVAMNDAAKMIIEKQQRRIKMRAIVTENAFTYRTVLDGVIVGRGGQKGCQALADELNASDKKCDALLRAFA